MAGVDARRPAAQGATRGQIGLIAGDCRREVVGKILAVLAREGLAAKSFACAETIAETAGGFEPTEIVLCLEHDVSSAASLVELLVGRYEGVPVVLVCARIQRWEVRAALAAGAAGVVVHADLEEGLGSCLRAVRAGQVCVPRGHSGQIEPRALSAREKQVLALVAMGCMNSQIADRLFLAESTVKSHLSSAFGKLGVRSRHEAAELVLDPKRGLGTGILGLGGESPPAIVPPVR
jgi:DNA-binding NarL/FixJ family response regulator